MRHELAALMLVFICSPAVALDQCVRSPSRAAQLFYKQHQEFIFSGASSPPLSEAFASAVNANITNQRRTGDSGPIDWNYWTDAQDGEQSRVAKLASVVVASKRAQVKLTYRFIPSPNKKSVSKHAVIMLSRSHGGCWLIEDVQRGKISVVSYLSPQQQMVAPQK